MFSVASSSIIRASGSPTYSMISTIIGAIINLILDPILIFKFNMGVQGAAVATITGQVVSAIMCLLYFKKPKLMKLNKDCFKIDFSVISKLAKLGISSFITQISVAIITIVANNIVGIIGGVNATDAGGALGIVFKIFGIVIAFSIGFSVGGQPIIGFNYGAKEYKRVLETYKQIILANVIIGLVSLILFQFFPEYIVKIFGGQANDIDFYQNYAILCFKIYLGGILFCCIQKASCIFLQSIDRPYKAMLLSLTRDVILLVPAVCLLGLFGNLYTMLYAGIIADVGAFILTIVFVAIEYKNISKLAEEKVEVKEFSNNKRFVISIGREYGSGGKYIGEMLAKRLNINCYDNEILKEVASDYNIDIDTLEKVDEKQKSSFWYGFANNYFFSEDGKISPISAEDNLFLKQARVIEKLYEKEDCVIIGRCSDYILKNKQNVISIFVYSPDMDFKIARKQEFEKLSKDKAKKKILKIDKERSNYYNHFTSQIWGDKNNYDILVDSSKLGVDKTVDVLENYIKEKLK